MSLKRPKGLGLEDSRAPTRLTASPGAICALPMGGGEDRSTMLAGAFAPMAVRVRMQFQRDHVGNETNHGSDKQVAEVGRSVRCRADEQHHKHARGRHRFFTANPRSPLEPRNHPWLRPCFPQCDRGKDRARPLLIITVPGCPTRHAAANRHRRRLRVRRGVLVRPDVRHRRPAPRRPLRRSKGGVRWSRRSGRG